MRKALALCLVPALIAGALFLPDRASGQPGGGASIAACDTILMEPLVIRETSGFGIAGPLHFRFSVYNNGLVSISRMTFTSANSKADFIQIPPSAAQQLLDDLKTANAFRLCDQQEAGADQPPTTLTVFNGKADAKAHTFTYYFGTNQYAGVEQILLAFQQTWFPNF